MHDAVADEDVGLQDAGAVDELRVGRHGDGDGRALHAGEAGPVGQAGGVADEVGRVHDVVGQQLRQRGRGEVFERLAERREGRVGGHEEGQVRCGGEGGVEGVRGRDGAEEGGQVEGRRGGLDGERGDEEGVDDMGGAVGVVHVLITNHLSIVENDF